MMSFDEILSRLLTGIALSLGVMSSLEYEAGRDGSPYILVGLLAVSLSVAQVLLDQKKK